MTNQGSVIQLRWLKGYLQFGPILVEYLIWLICPDILNEMLMLLLLLLLLVVCCYLFIFFTSSIFNLQSFWNYVELEENSWSTGKQHQKYCWLSSTGRSMHQKTLKAMHHLSGLPASPKTAKHDFTKAHFFYKNLLNNNQILSHVLVLLYCCKFIDF